MDIEVSVTKNRVRSKTVKEFGLAPAALWQLLAAKESAPVFRVEARKQLAHSSDGVIVERVTFVAPVRIVFWKKWARTEVHQTVDLRDPSSVRVNFSLLHSDMMSHLSGSWHFEQLEPPGRTRVSYNFEMWPKGVPTALRFMPGLLDAVKAAVSRESAQLFEKLEFVASKVQPGRCVLEGARLASAQVLAAGGSFKCLVLQQSGNAADAAAAAAAEKARQQLLKGRGVRSGQQVVCHALDDLLSDDAEDCSSGGLIPAGSCLSSGGCSSTTSTTSTLSLLSEAGSSGDIINSSSSSSDWESEPGTARNSSSGGGGSSSSSEDGCDDSSYDDCCYEDSNSPSGLDDLAALLPRLFLHTAA